MRIEILNHHNYSSHVQCWPSILFSSLTALLNSLAIYDWISHRFILQGRRMVSKRSCVSFFIFAFEIILNSIGSWEMCWGFWMWYEVWHRFETPTVICMLKSQEISVFFLCIQYACDKTKTVVRATNKRLNFDHSFPEPEWQQFQRTHTLLLSHNHQSRAYVWLLNKFRMQRTFNSTPKSLQTNESGTSKHFQDQALERAKCHSKCHSLWKFTDQIKPCKSLNAKKFILKWRYKVRRRYKVWVRFSGINLTKLSAKTDLHSVQLLPCYTPCNANLI